VSTDNPRNPPQQPHPLRWRRPPGLFLALLRNGYVPLPNADKSCRLPGWSSVEVDEEQATLWDRSVRFPAVGLRVEPPLLVVDMDVPEAIAAARLREVIAAVAPNVLAGLERIGSPPKAAFFLRYEGSDSFRLRQTRIFKRDPEDRDSPSVRVQIFGGGGGAAQFGAFGPHSFGADGQIAKLYSWVGPSPAEVPLAALPAIGRHEVFAICDEAETVFKAAGLRVAGGVRGEAVIVDAYDLDEASVFEGEFGEVFDIAALADAVAAQKTAGGPRVRVTGSFTGDPHSTGSLRCLVSVDLEGDVVIHDTKTNTTHRLRVKDPGKPDYDAEFAELLRKMG
jgi:hypothetical protein